MLRTRVDNISYSPAIAFSTQLFPLMLALLTDPRLKVFVLSILSEVYVPIFCEDELELALDVLAFVVFREYWLMIFNILYTKLV